MIRMSIIRPISMSHIHQARETVVNKKISARGVEKKNAKKKKRKNRANTDILLLNLVFNIHRRSAMLTRFL